MARCAANSAITPDDEHGSPDQVECMSKCLSAGSTAGTSYVETTRTRYKWRVFSQKHALQLKLIFKTMEKWKSGVWKAQPSAAKEISCLAGMHAGSLKGKHLHDLADLAPPMQPCVQVGPG